MNNYQEFIERKTKQYGNKFDASDLNPAFIPYYENGERITVDFGYEKKRGTIGITTGWKPVFLLMLRISDHGSSYTIGKDAKIVPNEKGIKMVYMATRGKRAVITYNKKHAFTMASQKNDHVYQLTYQYYKDCHFSMDIPTFIAVGKKIK